ncbi:sigma 54-interacting transcriptional regulator [Edaphobacter aggregans]|uniref:sigma 54-interacting transcriptional regulator n=1 Tax=Edaphobacter aggregans TaxID=570835 RepID=UPI00068BF3AD|nr:sigma 54-interacting transcriptional regulator [Edaphobacter aggregans]
MLRFTAFSNQTASFSAVTRYGIVIASVAGAFTVVFLLQNLHVRDPFALIFLAAIAVSVWYGGSRPGLLGIILSTLALNIFLHSPRGWFHISTYDLPVFSVFLLFAFWIYRFGELRHHTEFSLMQARDHLETEVQARTAELRRINTENETILDGAPFGIALFGPDRIVRRCNRGYERMLGFEPGELTGHPAPLPESEKEAWKVQEKQLRAGQRIVDYEAPRRRKDGSEFSATISATPLFDENEAYVGLVGLVIDNTERLAQEAERRMLTTLVQHSPDFVGVADLTGNAVFVNEAGQKLFGLEGEEHVRRTNVLACFADEAKLASREELIPLLMQRGQLECETLGRNFQTGKVFPLHCSCFVIPDGKTGEPALVAAIAQDISERNRAEAKLQMFSSVVQNSPDFIGVADMSLHTVFVNRAGQRMFGLEGDEGTIGTHCLDYFSEDQHRAVRDDLIPTLLDRGELTREVPARNFKTGESFPALWTAFVIYDQKTRQPSLLATVTKDITKQHEDRETLQKSLKDNEVLLEENRALQEKLRRENISLQEMNLALQDELAAIQKDKFETIVGGSPALRRTLNKVEQVAATDATVLITGETGTGKELIAQAIHKHSKRARMPFRSINCAALPATLMAAELFGHEKGAFTGADRQRVGQFELAAGGTLFLDEIAEIPIETQATLLRVLEEHTFERLGGSKSIAADVRVIAATNRDLQVAMRAGEFRPDLFYRLNAFPIDVPPLRDRRDDIPMLVTHFIALSAVRHGKTIRNIEKRGMELLRAYDWPGNIRELRNVIDTSVIVSAGEVLSIDEELLFATRPAEDAPVGSLQKEMTNHERMLIERALAGTQGRVYGLSGAAAILHLPPTTLSAKMKALKIDASKFKPR